MSKLSIVVASPPVAVVEPVGLAEAKTHCRIDGTADDSLISGLIRAAREYSEKVQGRAFVTRTYQYVTEARFGTGASRNNGSILRQAQDACNGRIELPMPPFVALTSIKGRDSDGVETDIPIEDYKLDVDGTLAVITILRQAQDAEKVVVVYTAGYGTSADVPQTIKQAILLMVSYWYEHRETAEAALSGSGPVEIPYAVEALINLDRVNWGF